MPYTVSDKLYALNVGDVQMHGVIDDKLRLVCEQTLKKIDMHALADYFRYRTDAFATGEFWGKLMRILWSWASAPFWPFFSDCRDDIHNRLRQIFSLP